LIVCIHCVEPDLGVHSRYIWLEQVLSKESIVYRCSPPCQHSWKSRVTVTAGNWHIPRHDRDHVSFMDYHFPLLMDSSSTDCGLYMNSSLLLPSLFLRNLGEFQSLVNDGRLPVICMYLYNRSGDLVKYISLTTAIYLVQTPTSRRPPHWLNVLVEATPWQAFEVQE
jgi:hypothetical protein